MPKRTTHPKGASKHSKPLQDFFRRFEQCREELMPQLQAVLAKVRIKSNGKSQIYNLNAIAKIILETVIPAKIKELTDHNSETVKTCEQVCSNLVESNAEYEQVMTTLFLLRSVLAEHIAKGHSSQQRSGLLEACEEFWLLVLYDLSRSFLRDKDRVIREKNMESSVLFHTTQSISTELDLESLLNKIVFHAGMLMHIRQVFLFLVQNQPDCKDGKRLELSAWNQPGLTYGNYSVRFGEGHVGKVAVSKQALAVNNYSQAPEKIPFLSEARRMLVAPICFADEILGVLLAADSGRERFTGKDKELLQVFASQIAVTLKNVLLFQEQSKIARELEEKNRMLETQSDVILRKSAQLVVMNEVSQQVNSSLELPEVLSLLARHAADSIGVNRGIVWLMDSQKIQLEAVAAYGLSLDLLGQLSMFLPDIRRARFFQALSEQHAVELTEGQDVEVFQGVLKGILQVRSMLAVPLLLKHQAIGLLVVDDTRETHDFLEDEVALVSAIANQAVLAIENARLYLQVKEQAITDGLTSLYNHRYFQLRFAEEYAHCRRYGNDLSLIMMDIDHFKHYNDTYGHIAGDLALKEIAGLTRASVRENDIVARYGGEEIVIILPMTPLEGAKIVAERIRSAVQECKFLGDMNIPQVSITVSLGVSSYAARHENRELLLQEADMALYAAKEAGRNRVMVYVPEN